MRKIPLIALSSAIALALTACDVEQTEEGEMPDVDVDATAGQMPEYEVIQTQEGQMPDVDVDVEPGNMPEYDVDTADVEFGTKEVDVTVPDVDVDVSSEVEQVTVPTMDVDMPDDDDPEYDEEVEEPLEDDQG